MNRHDSEQIARVITDYLTSWYSGDHAIMAACLHPSLIKRRLATDRDGGLQYLNCLQRDEMIAATEAGLGVARSNRFKGVDVVVFAITGDIATAQATTGEWIDYLHLVRSQEGWKIVNCLYSASAE
jgi:hypothetical protein